MGYNTGFFELARLKGGGDAHKNCFLLDGLPIALQFVQDVSAAKSIGSTYCGVW